MKKLLLIFFMTVYVIVYSQSSIINAGGIFGEEPFASSDSVFKIENPPNLNYNYIFEKWMMNTMKPDSFNVFGKSDIKKSEKGIYVYPKPYTDKINIKDFNCSDPFILTSMSGQIIYFGKDISRQDFAKLNAGIYLVRVKIEKSDFYQTLRLVKQ
jgi:hypothetical protein